MKLDGWMDGTGWDALMEWDGMGWNGMDWDGMGWNGMEWDGIGWMEGDDRMDGMEWDGWMKLDAGMDRKGCMGWDG